MVDEADSSGRPSSLFELVRSVASLYYLVMFNVDRILGMSFGLILFAGC